MHKANAVSICKTLGRRGTSNCGRVKRMQRFHLFIYLSEKKQLQILRSTLRSSSHCLVRQTKPCSSASRHHCFICYTVSETVIRYLETDSTSIQQTGDSTANARHGHNPKHIPIFLKFSFRFPYFGSPFATGPLHSEFVIRLLMCIVTVHFHGCPVITQQSSPYLKKEHH